jgi:hypothetical protein
MGQGTAKEKRQVIVHIKQHVTWKRSPLTFGCKKATEY